MCWVDESTVGVCVGLKLHSSASVEDCLVVCNRCDFEKSNYPVLCLSFIVDRWLITGTSIVLPVSVDVVKDEEC